MSAQPWNTKNWFTSPWNFVDEVTADFNFSKNIKIHDVTLRDGEQQTGIAFNMDDKIRIAEGLAEAGIHRIEAGLPAVSPADFKAISEIVKRNLGPQIFAFSRCMKNDVQAAVDAGVTGVVMEVPSSQHIIEHAYKWPLDKAIDLSIESTAFAHEQGLEVVFFPIDFTRAEINWVLDLITRVADEGHMDALALVDTFGVTSPHAMKYFVREVKKRISGRLEAHFHQDFGMGVANTIMALAEGVEVVQSTVLGLGERAGNAPTEDVVMALLTMYGIDIGINYDKLYPLSQMVQEIAGVAVPRNRGVVGKDLFKVESGIIANWFANCGIEHQTELFPFRPELVGQPEAEVVLGKGSGVDSIKLWLEKFQIQASEEETMEILGNVKAFGVDHKRLLTYDEFKEIAGKTVAIA
ncbi:MAG: pyruvate carboxyltransferase [SAR324 cluster bacterium]|nr:pyruvate carboxyltransferase [SAR324 cluster bacterium]